MHPRRWKLVLFLSESWVVGSAGDNGHDFLPPASFLLYILYIDWKKERKEGKIHKRRRRRRRRRRKQFAFENPSANICSRRLGYIQTHVCTRAALCTSNWTVSGRKKGGWNFYNGAKAREQGGQNAKSLAEIPPDLTQILRNGASVASFAIKGKEETRKHITYLLVCLLTYSNYFEE